MALKFDSCVEKKLKLNVKSVEEIQQGTFLHFSPPPILYRVERELKDYCPMKTLKRRNLGFIASLPAVRKSPVLSPPLYLKICLGTLNQLFLSMGEQGRGNCAVELACLQMFNISLLKIFIYLFTLFTVGTILVVTNKNQPTN